jgi:hypothetical protein
MREIYYNLRLYDPSIHIVFTNMNQLSQNLINESNNEQTKTTKNPWTVASYAPSRLDKNNNLEHKEIQNTRRSLYLSKSQNNTKFTDDLRKQANTKAYEAQKASQATKISEAAMREHNRKFFLDRKNNKKILSNSYISHDVEATLNVRLISWNKHHNCPHLYKFNKIWKTVQKYEIGCNHSVSKITTDAHIDCNHCGCKTTKTYKTPCECIYALCMRCKTSTFAYEYTDIKDGRLVKYFQHFDKHSSSQETFFIEPLPIRNEPKSTVDMTPREEIPIVLKTNDKKQSRISRANFFRSLSASPSIISYSKATSGKFSTIKGNASSSLSSFDECSSQLSAEVDRKLSTKKYGLDSFEVVDSIPEGGKISTTKPKIKEATVDTKNILSKMSTAFAEARNKYVANAIKEQITNCQAYIDAMQFFEATLYVLKVVSDYVDVTNILLIFDIYKSFASGSSFSTITGSLRAIHLLALLKENEESSLNQFLGLLSRAQMLKDDYKATFLFTKSFGCLTTIIRKYLLDKKIVIKHTDTKYANAVYSFGEKAASLEELKQLLLINNIFGQVISLETLKPDKDLLKDYMVIASTSESNTAILAMLSNFCSHIPSSFGVGAKMFSGFCKTLMPILSVAKVSADLTKICSQSVDKFMEWWSGTYADNRRWLSHKMATIGNPVNDLQVAYMAVRSKAQCGSLIGSSMTDLRSMYYSLKITAEIYATEEKQFSAAFTQYIKSQETGMSDLGTPDERPFEPTSVAFVGKPGYGKSTVWPVLVAGPLGLKGKKNISELVRRSTHTWDPASEFQTGMSNKKVILFDDFGQDKSTNKEALNLIAMVSVAEYHVNSAYITGAEIKGSAVVPEHIVICSNDKDLGTSLIFSSGAVKRRVDITFEFAEKLTFDNVDKPFLNIIDCVPYPNLIGSCVSLSGATAIYSLIDFYKKQKLKILGKKLSETTNEILNKMKVSKIDFAESEIVKNLAQDSDFAKDYKAFLAHLKNEVIESTDEAGADVEYIYSIIKASFAVSLGVGSSLAVIAAWADVSQTFISDVKAFKLTKNFFKSALTAVIVTVGVVGIYNIYSLYTSDSAESGTTRTAKMAIKTISSKNEVGETYTNLVGRATGTLQLSDGITVNCIFIGSHYILTVNHFFLEPSTLKNIAEDTPIKITKSSWNKGTKTFPFKLANLISIGGTNIVNNMTVRQDIVIYKLDSKTFSAEKNIINHFWNGEYGLKNFEVTKYDFLSSALNVTTSGNDIHMQSVGTVESDRIYTTRRNGVNLYYHEAAQASYKSRAASCGSLIMSNHTQEHPLLGIHIAVSNSTGLSLFHFVTRDDLTKALENYEKMDLQESGVIYSANECPLLPENSILEFIGYVTPAHQNTKTDLVPSTIYNMFEESLTEPAPLTPHDPRLQERSDYTYVKENFYKILFEGYQQNPTFTEEDLREGTEYVILKNKNIKRTSIVPQKCLSLHEAINGIKSMPANTRIEMTTSTGYPYTITGMKRTDLFFEINGVLHPTPRIVDDFNSFLDNLKKGIVPMTPYTLTIKDEKIKKTKIYDALKPRLFSSGNIISLLIQRKFFYSHIMAHYHAKETYSAVKLDRLSLDWHELITYMQEGGNVGFDADFKFWDRSIGKVLVCLADEVALSYIKKDIVSEIGELGYNTLIEWDSSPYYVSGKKLYRGTGTIPSGKLPTFISNCDINEILHISAYLAIMRKANPMLGNIKAYTENNKGKRGGDDTIQAVSDLIKDDFNGVTFSQWINTHGMTCTSADKSDKIVPYKPIRDLSFLKNTTGFLNGYYVPNPDRQSIAEMMYWIRINKNNKDKHKATADNINSALRNYYFYGPILYNNIRDTILEKFPSYVLNTYAENNLLWKEYKYFPGSHSDYSTRMDQGIDSTIDGVKKYDIAPIEGLIFDMDHKFILPKTQDDDYIVVSSPESGLDKNMIGLEEHPDVPIPDSTNFPVLLTEVANIEPGAQDKTRNEQLGTTIQESEQPLSGTVLTAGKAHSSRNRRAEASLNDKNWTLERLEKKYTLVSQIPWAISNSQGDLIALLNIPNDILVTPAQKSPFDITAFWRAANVTMKVIAKASAFYSGTLVAGFLPTMNTLTAGNVALLADFTTMIQLGGQVMQISDNQQLEFSIPFRHYYGFTEAPHDCLGQFVIFIVNPLRTGPTNDNNILISLYVAIGDSEFKIPEFIAPQYYRSAKFVNSIPESGETQISSTGQININDLVKDLKPVMLCAGEGLIGKMGVPQFQDHPTDIVLLRKRYTIIERTDPVAIGARSYGTLVLDHRTLMRAVVGDLDSMFMLYRGSINIKIFQYITLTGVDRTDNVATKVFMVPHYYPNQNLTEATISGNYHGGYSIMSESDPAELNLPYNSAVFTSTYSFDAPLPFAIEHREIVVEAYNYNVGEVEVSYEIHGCVGDDFSTGVFLGINSGLMPKKPTIVDSIAESGIVVTESGLHMIVSRSIPIPTIPLDVETIGAKLFLKTQRVSDAQSRRYAIYLHKKPYHLWTFQEIRNSTESSVLAYREDIDFVLTVSSNKLEPKHLKLRAQYLEAGIITSTPESGILDFIDKAVKTTVPIMEMIDQFGSLLDAHPVTVQPPPMKIKKQGFTVSCDNAQYIERLCVTNHNGMNLSDKETYGGDGKETDMYSLMTETKTFVEYHPWSTSEAVGTRLAIIKVGPSPEHYYKSVAPVDYFGTRFQWWAGSMVYIIDIAASALHKGQLTLSFHPNLTMDNPPANLQLATQQYFTTFDLEGGRGTIAVQVPFLQKKSYLPVEAVNPDGFSIPEHYNGIIVLWVQNALRGASSVSSIVDVNIYKMAGKDFKYDVYGTNKTLPLAP